MSGPAFLGLTEAARLEHCLSLTPIPLIRPWDCASVPFNKFTTWTKAVCIFFFFLVEPGACDFLLKTLTWLGPWLPLLKGGRAHGAYEVLYLPGIHEHLITAKGQKFSPSVCSICRWPVLLWVTNPAHRFIRLEVVGLMLVPYLK